MSPIHWLRVRSRRPIVTRPRRPFGLESLEDRCVPACLLTLGLPDSLAALENHPAELSAGAGTAVTIVDDYPIPGLLYLVTLSADHGTFDAPDSPLLSITGAGTALVSLEGTLDDLNAYFQTGLTLRPTGDFSGLATLFVRVVNPADIEDAGTVPVSVAPVAAEPTVRAAGATGTAGTAIPLSVRATPNDADGSESVTGYVLTGYPAGATFNVGRPADGGGGNMQLPPVGWFVPAGDIGSLTITPALGTFGAFTLTATASVVDVASTGTDTSSGSAAFTLTVVPPPAELAVEGATLDENGLASLGVSLADDFGPGGDGYSLTLRVRHGVLSVPGGSGLTVTGNGTRTLTVGGDRDALAAFLAAEGVAYAPDAFFSGDDALNAALATPDGRVTPAEAWLGVLPVAQTPTPGPTTVRGRPGEWRPLSLPVAVRDPDGSEALAYVEFTDLERAALSAGGFVGGAWRVPAANLPGLMIAVFGSEGDVVELPWRAVTRDRAVLDGEAYTDDSEPGLGVLTATVGGPHVSYYYDGTVRLDENGSDPFFPTPDIDDRTATALDGYALTLSAGDATLGVDGEAAIGYGVGVSGNGTALVTLTGNLADLQAFLADSRFTFTPTPFFSGFAGVTAELLSADGMAASDGIEARVSPVAQVPTVNAGGAEGGVEAVAGSPLGVTFSAQVNDPDGSESIVGYAVQGLPSGWSFNHGVGGGEGGGTWLL
ncbi:MAG: hypothetical protein ACRC33_32170, partial [Gemmataceae bacterium]